MHEKSMSIRILFFASIFAASCAVVPVNETSDSLVMSSCFGDLDHDMINAVIRLETIIDMSVVIDGDINLIVRNYSDHRIEYSLLEDVHLYVLEADNRWAEVQINMEVRDYSHSLLGSSLGDDLPAYNLVFVSLPDTLSLKGNVFRVCLSARNVGSPQDIVEYATYIDLDLTLPDAEVFLH